MREPLDARVGRLRQQIAAFRKLHGDELQMILEEMRALVEELEVGAAAPTPRDPAVPTPADPAAGSLKRAQWLAEQERRARRSRRDLLRGSDLAVRDDEGEGKPRA